MSPTATWCRAAGRTPGPRGRVHPTTAVRASPSRPPRPASEPAPGSLALPPWLDRALRGATVVAVLGLGAVGLAQPDSVLRGGVAWLGFLVCVLAGWGTIVARLARAGDCDVGLRAA